MEQLSLLDTTEKQSYEVDKGTTVKLGKRSVRVFMKKRHREAVSKLKETLRQLEGKDVVVSQYCDYWCYHDLRLNRLQVQWFQDDSGLVLWGTRGGEVRIMWLEFLYSFREQYCGDKPYYLLDFWNGFRSSPLDSYFRGGYQCLEIRPAR